jgi:release factor glutamine methyltransferase
VSVSAPTGRGRDLYQAAATALGQPREARWILEEASGEKWPAALDVTLSDKAADRFARMVARRRGGEPLQYVVGSWGFRGLDLMVDPRVLIPRPETEQVVDAALAELDRLSETSYSGSRTPVVVDLGTGSGAIALAVAAERSGVSVWATDVSTRALEVAGANLAGLGGFAAAQVRLATGSWWSALPEGLRREVDVVVSNPPYVSAPDMARLDPQVRDWEPRLALEGGASGLDSIEEILAEAPTWLRPGGAAVIEIGAAQSDGAAQLARRSGFQDVQVLDDLAGLPRILVARQLRPEQ